MKLNKALLLLAATGLAVASFAPGKKASFEGKIVFEINYEELPEMLEPYRAMLPKETVTYIKGSKTRVEQTTMGSLIVNVMDSDKKTGFMLTDQMGEKTAYTMDAADTESEQKKNNENLQIVYTKETKDIAGFKCTKVEVTDKTDKEAGTINVWVTEEISGSNKQFSTIKGYPLEYSVKAQMGMVMVIKAKTVEKTKVDNSLFEIPQGYTKKPMSELTKQMEQMKKMQGGEDE